MNTYKNRYAYQFHFEQVGDNKYKIVGSLKYCRYGGREGQQGVDMHDLGFIDPSGGPYMSVGYPLPIIGRNIKRIGVYNSDIIFEVESDYEITG